MMGGAGDSSGVLPRSLDTIFAVIGDNIHKEEVMHPYGSCYVREASSSEIKSQAKIMEELDGVIKDKTLRGGAEKRRSIMAVPPNLLSDSVQTGKHNTVDGEKFVAFASFYELYNEKVYDLLEKPKKDGKRKELNVKQDRKGTFVDKIRHVQLEKPADAYRVLEAGRRNLSVGQTSLNKDSSRSHCLFTIRLCRKLSDQAWQVSSLAFCDLAGTERAKKMGNASLMRKAESKTINQSLMQLRIVISDLRLQCQQKGLKNKGGKVAVAFRNSKLTRLMQCYLVGHSKTSIIIAVSNDPTQFEETQNSLKFAVTAQAVQLGLDRHGRALKDCDKLNISRQPTKKSLESALESAESDDNCWDSSNDNGPNYANFTKQELIDDLNWYVESEVQLQDVIHTMKVEWQKDELKWKEHYEYYADAKRDWQVDLQNARIHAHNDREQSEYQWGLKMDKKNAKIKELRSRLDNGVPDESKEQQIKELTEHQAELNQKIMKLDVELSEKRTIVKHNAMEHDAAIKELQTFRDQQERAENEIVTLQSDHARMMMVVKNMEDEMHEVKSAAKDRSANFKESRIAFENKINELSADNCQLQSEIDSAGSLSPIGPPSHRSSIAPSERPLLDDTTAIMGNASDSPSLQEDLTQQIEDITRERDQLNNELASGKKMYKQIQKENKTFNKEFVQLEGTVILI